MWNFLFFFFKLYQLTTGNMTRRGDREKTSSCCVLRTEIHWKPPGGSVMESAFYRAPSTLYRETASPSDKPHGLILGDMSVFLKTHWDLLGMWSTWALEVVSYRSILFFIVLLCFEKWACIWANFTSLTYRQGYTQPIYFEMSIYSWQIFTNSHGHIYKKTYLVTDIFSTFRETDPGQLFRPLLCKSSHSAGHQFSGFGHQPNNQESLQQESNSLRPRPDHHFPLSVCWCPPASQSGRDIRADARNYTATCCGWPQVQSKQ